MIWAVALGFLLGGVRPAFAAEHLWPDAPPAVLREEIFGIRFRLALRDKGGEAAAKLLRAELKKNPGSPEARAYAAWVSLFPKGWGIEPIVPEEACEGLLRGAMADGSAVAKDVLGFVLTEGHPAVASNKDEGLRLLIESAVAGFPRSIGRIGRMEMNGRHVPANPESGRQGLLRAMALGSTTDLAFQAEDYEYGRGGPPQPEWAMELYYQLALDNESLGWSKLREFTQREVPGAGLLLAVASTRFANEGGFGTFAEMKKNVAFLEQEGANDPRALMELGVVRLFGADGSRRDHQRAREYFQKAADWGNTEARFFLAYMRQRGFGGPREPEQALKEMTALADSGDARAAARLGSFYYWGTSDTGDWPKDPAKAFHYTRQAAEWGSRWAAINLAHCYKHGIGTRENPVLAAKLYWIAYNYGVRGAKEDLLRQLAFAKVP